MSVLCLLLSLQLATPAQLPAFPASIRPQRAERPKKEDTRDERSRKDQQPRKSDKDSKDEPAAAYEVIAEKNIPYRTGKDADPQRHKLDLYLPKGQKNFPVVFFVHGGGWHSGDKEMYAPMGRMLARNGIGGVIVNYRLSPKVKHPTHIEDVARAFAWTHANIGRYGGRSDEIVLCGHSAGGHLIALLSTDEKYLKAEKLGLQDIQGVVCISGLYAIDSIYGFYPSVFTSDRAARREASPRYHISRRCPPFLLLYADRDLPTIEKESEKFYDDLRQARCEARSQVIKNRTHISILLLAASDNDPATQLLFDFVEDHTSWKRPVTAHRSEFRKP